MLAKAGLKVTVVEEKGVIGGCVRTEYPFTKTAPTLAQSTGAYLLGVMPPELIKKLDIEIPTLTRDPHWFIPTDGKIFY
jgi:phytoene dehydrogenase-like protein